MNTAALALLRAQAKFVERAAKLGTRLDAGEDCWAEYAQAAMALAALAPATTPEARGILLTTEQLAERMQVSSKTVLRRAKRGELKPVRLGERGRGALRWPTAEAGR